MTEQNDYDDSDYYLKENQKPPDKKISHSAGAFSYFMSSAALPPVTFVENGTVTAGSVGSHTSGGGVVVVLGAAAAAEGNMPNTKWPCANCHAMVSEDRCPFCHGIQVKILNQHNVPADAGVPCHVLPKAWMERLSPTTLPGGARGRTTTPTTLPRPAPSTVVGPKHQPLRQLHPKQQEHQEPDCMMVDGELVELQENDDDDEEELEQTSESSPRHQDDADAIIEVEEFVDRPDNPVAFLLAAAETPPPKFEARVTMDEASREELKKQSKDRLAAGAPETGKKQRILFAM